MSFGPALPRKNVVYPESPTSLWVLQISHGKDARQWRRHPLPDKRIVCKIVFFRPIVLSTGLRTSLIHVLLLIFNIQFMSPQQSERMVLSLLLLFVRLCSLLSIFSIYTY